MCSIRTVVCRWSDHHCRVPRGTAFEGWGMEGVDGEESQTCDQTWNTKNLASVMHRYLQNMSGQDLRVVCLTEADRSAIFCGSCLHGCSRNVVVSRVHWNQIEFSLIWCPRNAQLIDEGQMRTAMAGDNKLEVLSDFRYLSGMFFAWSGCELTAVTGCKCVWGKFAQWLFSSHHPQSAFVGPRISVCNMFEGCEVAWIREKGQDNRYLELPAT